MDHPRRSAVAGLALAVPETLSTLVTRTRFWTALLLVAAGLAAAGTLTEGVLEHGDLSLVDPAVATDVVGWRGSTLTLTANVLSYWGSTAAVGMFGIGSGPSCAPVRWASPRS